MSKVEIGDFVVPTRAYDHISGTTSDAWRSGVAAKIISIDAEDSGYSYPYHVRLEEGSFEGSVLYLNRHEFEPVRTTEERLMEVALAYGKGETTIEEVRAAIEAHDRHLEAERAKTPTYFFVRCGEEDGEYLTSCYTEDGLSQEAADAAVKQINEAAKVLNLDLVATIEPRYE